LVWSVINTFISPPDYPLSILQLTIWFITYIWLTGIRKINTYDINLYYQLLKNQLYGSKIR
jgi:hypothetical protein